MCAHPNAFLCAHACMRAHTHPAVFSALEDIMHSHETMPNPALEEERVALYAQWTFLASSIQEMCQPSFMQIVQAC